MFQKMLTGGVITSQTTLCRNFGGKEGWGGGAYFRRGRISGTLQYNFPSKKLIQAEVIAFNESLAVKWSWHLLYVRETRGEGHSLKWFQWQLFRITSSHFAEVCQRRHTTPPDALILCLLGVNNQKRKDTVSMSWSRNNEAIALEEKNQEIRPW